MRVTKAQASLPAKGEGRKVRRWRNEVKRYASATDPDKVRRRERAAAMLAYLALAKGGETK